MTRGGLSLPPRLVEEERGGHADVEALDGRVHGDRDQSVARARHQRPQAAALRAGDDDDPAGEVGLRYEAAASPAAP